MPPNGGQTKRIQAHRHTSASDPAMFGSGVPGPTPNISESFSSQNSNIASTSIQATISRLACFHEPHRGQLGGMFLRNSLTLLKSYLLSDKQGRRRCIAPSRCSRHSKRWEYNLLLCAVSPTGPHRAMLQRQDHFALARSPEAIHVFSRLSTRHWFTTKTPSKEAHSSSSILRVHSYRGLRSRMFSGLNQKAHPTSTLTRARSRPVRHTHSLRLQRSGGQDTGT